MLSNVQGLFRRPHLSTGLDALVDGLVSQGPRVLLHSPGRRVDGLLVELVCLGPGLVGDLQAPTSFRGST